MKTSRCAIAAAFCASLALSAVAQTTMPMPSSGSPAAVTSALALGTIRAIDAAERILTIEHRAIPRLSMAGMTMDFRLDKNVSTDALTVGQSIAFTLSPSGSDIAISELQPIGSGGTAADASMPQQKMTDMKMSASKKEMMAKCHEMMVKPK